MNLSLSEEQEELRVELRRFFTDKASSAQLRHALEAGEGTDRALWAQLADQLGLPGLAIPEEYGGSGFTAMETGIVFEEMGRRLVHTPYFSTVGLAANVLLCSDDEQARKDLLPGLADGSTIATLALAGVDGRFDLDAVPTTATGSETGWTVSGQTAFVTDGMLADLILVVARTRDGISLFAVEATAAGLTRTAMSPLDLTRPLARVDFVDTPARLIGASGGARNGLAAGLDRAVAALAAEQVGAAAYCLELAVEYAKVREQFGRPIGSFQAVKHRAADMLVKVEAARSAVLYLNWAIAEDPDEVPLAAALAGAYCADAFFDVAADNIQIHGGIGYTWEHDAHLYFRRAKSGQLLFGTADSYRDRYAELVGF